MSEGLSTIWSGFECFNNFKTIVSACEEGRLIFSNIKKLFGYVLSNSFGYIIVIIKIICYNIRLDNKNDNKSINDVGIASYW